MLPRPLFLPDSDACYVCGRVNRMGLKVRFRVEPDGAVTTRFVADDDRCGFKGVVHGGVLTALLDETMGWAAAYRRRLFCVTAELRTRFLKPAPSHQPLVARGWVTADRSRLWEAEGDLRGEDGTLYARAWGKFVPMSPDATREVLDYLHFDDETVPLDELFECG